jgi:hypothetical protein
LVWVHLSIFESVIFSIPKYLYIFFRFSGHPITHFKLLQLPTYGHNSVL